MTFTAMFSAALPIGIGATMVMDLWGLLLRRMGVATLNFAMVGRWAGHLLHGRVRHQAIAKAEPVRHELALGWGIHYAIGVLFAMLLVMIVGEGWLLAWLENGGKVEKKRGDGRSRRRGLSAFGHAIPDGFLSVFL